MESLLRVMPPTRFVTEAFGVVTICLVALLVLLGLLCTIYSFYFRSRTRSQDFVQLSYFTGPWVIRITFVLFSIVWGLGEIVRLSLLRQNGRVLDSVSYKWQETFCEGYVVSNLGFAEPCLFLTLVFLLRAPLQRMESGILSRNWNGKTIGYILLYCLPVFALQLIIILVGPKLSKVKSTSTGVKSTGRRLPHYFTSAMKRTDGVALCTYPLMSTIILGVLAFLLTAYLFWLGRRILKLVINKGLQKRVYALIFSVSGFLPLRILLLGLSVLSKPEHILFEALVFLAFLSLFCCAGVCIFLLVYCPVADSLALGKLHDLELRRRVSDDQNETVSLIANLSHLEESGRMSPCRNSESSTKRGSISFRTHGKDGPSTATFVELSLFSPIQDVTPPGSPPLLGWPMRASPQVQGPSSTRKNQFCGDDN